MRLRRLAALLAALALAGGMAYAAAESNNALAVDANGGTVTFNGAKRSILFRNIGAQDVSIQVYDGTQTIAIHVHAATGSYTLPAGEPYGVGWDGGQDGGIGYIGFSWRCAAGQASTLKWIAK
jgi:type 1 fimbria pilin